MFAQYADGSMTPLKETQTTASSQVRPLKTSPTIGYALSVE